MTSRNVDEVLEALWTASEQKRYGLDALKEFCHVPIDEELLSELEGQGLIAHDGEMILLTREGKDLAANVRARMHTYRRKGWQVEKDDKKRVKVVQKA